MSFRGVTGLARVAWRNLWRNRRRTLIVLSSVVVGVFVLVLFDTLNLGMVEQMLDNQLRLHIGHVQIHHRGYHANPAVERFFRKAEALRQQVAAEPEVRAVAPRVLVHGLLSSAYNNGGVQLVGVAPEAESLVTFIADQIVAGRYLTGEGSEILIGERLARKLEVRLGDRVVAMAARPDGQIGSEVFRVVGLFRTVSADFDRTMAFIPIDRARAMLGLPPDAAHELAVLLDDVRQADALKTRLQAALPDTLEVLTYRDVVPLLVMQRDLYAEMMYLFYLIIGVALIFGIINAMLMAVLERLPEFGVLRALGMSEGRLFLLVSLESLLLGLLGTAIGWALSLPVYAYLARHGLDLAVFSEALAAFGVGSVIYPRLTLRVVWNAWLIIPLVAWLGALYPAWRAIHVEPVEAMRAV
ncbi:ABC transporter permease [Rhodothermus marinus]|uniref:ABC transporter permease n=1 Tax=Rhodothermus marinus (strain ATCC 43812 / DSM 4252 / R-10) TaxID=518766 RepID=D0MFS2_RHOM4|nr:ABC transporter permease [Rhodothermus marinus]ACY49411.1 protein of unknown function DUF214 [Rhodothermus marinus DSM 4252]